MCHVIGSVLYSPRWTNSNRIKPHDPPFCSCVVMFFCFCFGNAFFFLCRSPREPGSTAVGTRTSPRRGSSCCWRCARPGTTGRWWVRFRLRSAAVVLHFFFPAESLIKAFHMSTTVTDVFRFVLAYYANSVTPPVFKTHEKCHTRPTNGPSQRTYAALCRVFSFKIHSKEHKNIHV